MYVAFYFIIFNNINLNTIFNNHINKRDSKVSIVFRKTVQGQLIIGHKIVTLIEKICQFFSLHLKKLYCNRNIIRRNNY